jgi:hypothetical protein
MALTIFFCFSGQSDLSGQVLTRIFDNQSTEAIELLVDGKVIATIPQLTAQPVDVNFRDKVEVNVPNKKEWRWYSIYINELEDRGPIKIKPKVPWDQVTWATRGGRAPSVFFEQNVNGVHIEKYDPFVIHNSFEPTRIFAGIHEGCMDYIKNSGEEYYVDGFNYNGPTPYGTGEKKATFVAGEDNFKSYFSTGAEANIPMGAKGPVLNLGFNYSKNMDANIKESSYSFVKKKSVGIYSLAIDTFNIHRVRLSNNFIKAVELVLKTKDAKRLVDNFGTHYPVSVDYGGYFRSYISIEESAYRKAEEEGWDVIAGVSASMQATEIKSGDAKEGVERTDKYGGQSVGGKLKASGGTSREVSDLINKSHSHYVYVGGEGGFGDWSVNKDNSGAIAVELKEIYHLIHPHIMKTAWTKKECDAARKIIQDYVDNILKDIETKPISKVQKRVFKIKVNNLLKVDEVDDFNKRMKGNISVKVNGTTIPLWKSDKAMDMWKDGPNYPLKDNKWTTISQASDAEGNFAPIKFTFSGMLYEHDGVNDAYEIKMPLKGINGAENPNEAVELKSINGNNEYKVRYRHDHWGKFVVDAVIKVRAGTGFEDKFETEEESSMVNIRSAKSNKYNYTPNIKVTPVTTFGKKVDDVETTLYIPAEKAKEVKFFGQNGISMDQAKAISAQKGWKIASSFEVQAAFQHLKLDVYAFGMMADGRFAVPVQKDHSNFKKGPNIGAVGGNQGFFYTMPESTSTTTTTTTNTTEKSKDGLFDLNGAYYITDAKHKGSLLASSGEGVVHSNLPYNSPSDHYRWYFIPTGDGYYYIYNLQHNKALVGSDYYYGGSSNIALKAPNGKTNAQWKIVPTDKEGQYIITDRKHGISLFTADNNSYAIYHQPHDNQPNAYWTFTITDAKAPTNKPDPTIITEKQQAPPPPPPTKEESNPSWFDNNKTWVDNEYLKIQNKAKTTHYIYSQDSQLKEGPIKADLFNAQWKFIPARGKDIGVFQNRSNPNLYLWFSYGKLIAKEYPWNNVEQNTKALWKIAPSKEAGWVYIKYKDTGGNLFIENNLLLIGTIKGDEGNGLWKLE